MPYIDGQYFTKNEMMKRVGDISQIAGAKEYELSSGKARGIKAINIRNGSGLNFTVLADRGMDIAWADFKGVNLSFISKTRVVSPVFYEPEGIGFLRSFYGGLLTTCGLTYMGAACEDNGEKLGLHGRISNIPASDISVYQEWEDDDFVIKIRGKVTESKVFGENIVLTREISTRMGVNKIFIRDEIENCGFNAEPLMLLYHCNFGYPLVSKETELITSGGTVSCRDVDAEKGFSNYDKFEEPIHDYKEQVFYHDLKEDNESKVYAGLFNKNLGSKGVGVKISFDKSELPYLVEWKQMGEGDYVVGIEPGTWVPEGRAEARRRGELIYINPGEIKKHSLEFSIIEEVK